VRTSSAIKRSHESDRRESLGLGSVDQKYRSPRTGAQRQSGVRKRLQIAVSVACLVVIGLGVRYAAARETLREQDLIPLYQQSGQVLFGDDVPEARVEWANLNNDLGTERTFGDDSVEILVDRELVTSEKQLRAVMEHEVCHVYVDRLGGEPVEHGPLFQTCMLKFK
jgi:hypothetical protein